MPRDRTRSSESESLAADWKNTLIERIRKGGVTPVISNAVGDDLVLGGHERLVQLYASQAGHPTEQASLARVAQFKGIIDEAIPDVRALKEGYLDFIKNRLFD